MGPKGKVEIVSSHNLSIQPPASYPECRKINAQKAQLSYKLNRILVNSKIEITKKNNKVENDHKYRLDCMDREMKSTRERLSYFKKEMAYGHYMAGWFKRVNQSDPVVSTTRQERDKKSLSLPDIRKNTNSLLLSSIESRDEDTESENEENDDSELDGSKEVGNEVEDSETKTNKGFEYEIKFMSDQIVKKNRRATFLERNYTRNSDRLMYKYLNEKKQFVSQQQHMK